MNAIEFVNRYPTMLEAIKTVIKPELYPVIDKMLENDPHDFVRPNDYFPLQSGIGLVMTMFMNEVREFELSDKPEIPTRIEILEDGLNVGYFLNGGYNSSEIQQDQEGDAYFIWYNNENMPSTFYLEAITENN